MMENLLQHPRKQVSLFWLNIVFIILAVSLLRLPLVFGFRFNYYIRSFGILPYIPLIVLNFYSFFRNKFRIPINTKLLLICSLYFLLWIIAILRTTKSHTQDDPGFLYAMVGYFLILILFVISVNVTTEDKQKRRLLLYSIIYSFGLYIVLNLLFHLIGHNPHDELFLIDYPNQMLSLLGINSFRVVFPMADGLNNFGSIAALTLVSTYQLALRGEKNRLLLIPKVAIGVSSFIVIILSDSRGALLSAIAVIIALSVFRRYLKILPWMFIFVSLIPIFIVTTPEDQLQKYLAWLNRPKTQGVEVIEQIDRDVCSEQMESKNGILSNRTLIWRNVIDELSLLKESHLIGFGFRGQAISSISDNYNCLFRSYINRDIVSTHNIWFQIIVDIGYVGLAITMFMFFMMLSPQFSRIVTRNYPSDPVFAVIICVLIMGALEAVITPDFFEVFLLILMISFSAVFIQKDEKTLPIS